MVLNFMKGKAGCGEDPTCKVHHLSLP